ncbi:hypothetical protein BpHYR1_003546 [Brachionus plicatilis]|uniref:Uncharacterized protein n=1 Tax=Brachionus plicatilis TaxID=10195 RepID=A0A3M7QDU9_BRAPC|nr:hypothetical protein BpHYR1_003546 [Brachionus plicatilis]
MFPKFVDFHVSMATFLNYKRQTISSKIQRSILNPSYTIRINNKVFKKIFPINSKELISKNIRNIKNLIKNLECFKCANYGRLQNDFVSKSSCNTPTSNDQSTFCEAAYCFKSSVLMADLSSSILRGCASSDKIYELSTKLVGYQSELNFCNTTNFCNSASTITRKSIFSGGGGILGGIPGGSKGGGIIPGRIGIWGAIWPGAGNPT